MCGLEGKARTRSGGRLAAILGVLGGTVLVALGGQQALPASPVDGSAVRFASAVQPVRALAGSVLYRSPELALPATLAVAGERLVLGDAYADRSLRVIRRDGTAERAFGRKGRGPREFESILTMDVVDPGGLLMVFDPTLQRVTWIDLNADFRGDRWVADRSVTLQAPTLVLAATASADGLMGVGAFRDGRLARLSPSGQLLGVTGPPPATPGTVTPRTWTRAYQARVKARPDRTRFAVAARFADRIEIYGPDGSLLATGDRPYGFDPGDVRDDDTGAVRFGYLDLATTDRLIYALFSGRVRDDGDAYLGDRIHVFDWDGRLRAVWSVDARLMALAVTPDGRWLYGVRHTPDPAVLAYRLAPPAPGQAE